MTRRNSRPPKKRNTRRKHARVRVGEPEGRGRTKSVETHKISDLEVLITSYAQATARLIGGNLAEHARFDARVITHTNDLYSVFITSRTQARTALIELRPGMFVRLMNVTMARDSEELKATVLRAKGYEIL